MSERLDKTLQVLYGAALVILVLAITAWGFGYRLAMRPYQTLGLYLLAAAVLAALAATILWAVDWVRSNVKIQ